MICGFIQEDFFMFSIGLCKTCGPLGQDHFRPQDHNLNKLGRGPLVLVMLHTKYQSSICLVVLDKKIFYVFPIEAYVSHVTPGTGPFMAHGHNGHNLNKFGRG